MSALDIKGLTCSYGLTRVISDLNLKIANGEIICLLGKSGCGKSTLLKAISGLLQPENGSITVHDTLVSSSEMMVSPENRNIGMIFQDYALFPHLDVFHNVAFGLKGQPRSDIKKRVQEMLELVSLEGLEKRYPHELSGGQQQRVAIARSLARKPSLLLLDEPFSNIDSEVRQRLIRDIRQILKQQHVAALFVTHSKEEGLDFADSVATMEQGRIRHVTTAKEVSSI
ncbi:ABC transporter ATP-binding protein [Sansalvadorimonas sp. 2012CJ34-2]|uniref:ABC transporter ATP-binding protein n=1 Tax=Parendozoicomonas callyspongiae TaxID=2942213 RepID=A0ABT0PB31_9GAMM|nr:ABC transporter ATP-binding protein [Sansalvadorimonas sp. 2012CJ34-2]MCL6268594.1 ABC transporter ATP-binding protein [Sansalvadorimonas sp. 2012CJ34-2]